VAQQPNQRPAIFLGQVEEVFRRQRVTTSHLGILSRSPVGHLFGKDQIGVDKGACADPWHSFSLQVSWRNAADQGLAQGKRC